jgi:magnesium chelatase subunit D
MVLAMRCAQAHALLAGRTEAIEEDLEAAAALVLAPRAKRLPAEADGLTEADDGAGSEPETAAPGETDLSAQDDDARADATDQLQGEILVAAARAALPPGLLERLAAGRIRGTPAARSAAGTGDRRAGHRRGRPLPSRPGLPDGRSRIDIVATLRRAAPWQAARRSAEPARAGLILRPSDIVLRRTEEVSERVLVFLVDASGSAAMARLAEVKGAVELMLGRAYARRDHVALVAFRGRGAETLLAPTRSLTRAKRTLAGLAGGGATPLAAGLLEGMALARTAAGRGMTPSLVLLSDGQANVARDGTADRPQAAADAQAAARAARAAGLGGIVIDAGQRQSAALAELARQLGAAYIPLPRAGARAIRDAAIGALGD